MQFDDVLSATLYILFYNINKLPLYYIVVEQACHLCLITANNTILASTLFIWVQRNTICKWHFIIGNLNLGGHLYVYFIMQCFSLMSNATMRHFVFLETFGSPMCCYQTSSEMLYIDGFFNSSASWVVQDNGVKLIGGALDFWWHSAVSDSIYTVERCQLCRHFQAIMKHR